MTNSQRKVAILCVFFPIDSVAFGTHTKTAEPTEMPFGMISGLSLWNCVLREGDDLRRGKGNSVEMSALQA